MEVLVGLSYFVAAIFLLLGMLYVAIPLAIILLLIELVSKGNK